LPEINILDRGKICSVNPSSKKIDSVIAEARIAREEREKGYRAQALKLFPHICGHCSREFDRKNLHELTVHHLDHNHDNNPSDGSNWALLCLYCHDNEHQRQQLVRGSGSVRDDKMTSVATHKPFAELNALLKKNNKEQKN
jgi:5-methylcytosine-specific restriction endonuclease McrA